MEPKNQKSFFNKCIWAVDLFSEDLDLEKSAASLVRTLSTQLHCPFEPVFVLRPGVVDSALSSDELEVMYRQAEDRLNSFLERNETTGLLPPRFLSAEGTPLRKSTDALVDYIKASGTDLVVLSTHARKGMPRLFLGSFAETLMLYSPVPILVVNPQVRAATSIDQFLFPTDFSDESREVYLRTLDLAKVFGARVILMHQVEYLYPDLLYPFVIPPVEPGSVAEVERAQENLGKEWVRLAQEQGADIEFRLIPHGRDLGAELEKVSRYYSTVIAMASRSGELSSALLGSRTRRIVREGHSPVLVFHPVRTRAKQRAA